MGMLEPLRLRLAIHVRRRFDLVPLGRVELASACKDFKRSYVNVYDTQIHDLKRERLRGEP